MSEQAVRCVGCHAQGQWGTEELLRLRAEGVVWLTCTVCGGRYTTAELAVYNSVFPKPAPITTEQQAGDLLEEIGILLDQQHPGWREP